MSKIIELRQKRAKLWEDTKKFLDNAKRGNNGLLSAADVETYEKWRRILYRSKRR